ncbi:HAD family hydrolase [Clostridium oceanicum]|uniref:HAD hydrolase family protein n=1 Tax=Clostridium oceanicum TaxID=1543 RepID=A0ABP3UYN4_9CLOT
MICVDIPGWDTLNIENIVFDYNGTVAVDGILTEKVKENLKKLSETLKIYIITADTYGNVRREAEGLPLAIETFSKGNATAYKKEFVEKLGSKKTVAVGNGKNDLEMFKKAVLSICVLGEEGCFSKSLIESDIVVKNIESVFAMFKNKNRIKATLRD